MLAYKAQADVHGDISKETRKYLAAISKDGGGKLQLLSRPKSSHRSGTLYEREHDGVLHRVMKTERGFQWKEKEYKSLSAVAYAITGTKWNGRRFFGVDLTKGSARG
jgi:hypothetical protein